MPISLTNGKEDIVQWFESRKDIKTIVDIGPGEGTYPKLLGTQKYEWSAIEIWAPYITTYNLNQWYKNIIIADIKYALLPLADCAIAGDIIEHLSPQDATMIIKRLDTWYRHVVISIPLNMPQDITWKGNWFEKHLSIWTWEDINKIVPESFSVRLVRGPLAIFIK